MFSKYCSELKHNIGVLFPQLTDFHDKEKEIKSDKLRDQSCKGPFFPCQYMGVVICNGHTSIQTDKTEKMKTS